MTRRAWMVVAGIGVATALLAGFQLAGRPSASSHGSAGAEWFAPDDFRVAIAPAADPGSIRRDPFHVNGVSRRRADAPAPPPRSVRPPAPTDAEAARGALSELRLSAVLFREGRGQALLTKGEDRYLVGVGETVAGRFIVERITPTSVALKDPATKVSGTIAVSSVGGE